MMIADGIRNHTTGPVARLPLAEIETRVCDIASEQLGLRRADVHADLRLIRDLHCDSLGLLEFEMKLEDAFCIRLPDQSQHPLSKAVFTRDEVRLRDFAEAIYLFQDVRHSPRSKSRSRRDESTTTPTSAPFTQLGGRVGAESASAYDALGTNASGFQCHRRRRDGMICVRIPPSEVTLGSEDLTTCADERPAHRAWLDGFLIDLEPVSTTAYCRFLNSIGPLDAATLADWFVLSPGDQRLEHMLLRHDQNGWAPLSGTERMPMMLVSWHGANAYALWANRREWRCYRAEQHDTFLPSEAQWEYAARGERPRRYPSGDAEPWSHEARFGRHFRGSKYRPSELPLADVNSDLGVSPFGLRHMAGNVWQWCRDWYSPDFYSTPQASWPNPVNRQSTAVRSERGGSWIGAASLCRSSYRRGRIPMARGRCLGFRCVGDLQDIARVF